jgi:transcriptional regulator with XRE-family HTH domain
VTGNLRKVRRRIIQDDGPDPIDIFVGKRLRERRRHADLSQRDLGARLGVSFQSVQKYETGDIRISAPKSGSDDAAASATVFLGTVVAGSVDATLRPLSAVFATAYRIAMQTKTSAPAIAFPGGK